MQQSVAVTRPDPLPHASRINAYSELVAAETAFREVIRSTVGREWVNDFTADKIAALEAKRTEEEKKRDGVSFGADLLDFTEAYQLESLILKHWDKTGPILKDKKRTEVYLQLMLDVRNTVAHARAVVPFERYLLAGIAGQVQNLISRYRSESETADAYYASVNSVRDSFGDEGTGAAGVANAPNQTRKRLKVGQVITFECSATDPHDRPIVWTFSLFGNSSQHRGITLGNSYGATAVFDWVVQPEHYGEGRVVVVQMANNSPYKRDGSSDAAVGFYYDVSPPLPPPSGLAM
jgi:hypothetical protein